MTIQLDQRPGLGRLYAKAVATARGRHGDKLPETSVAMADVAVDREQLASYADVCGFRQSDVLPPTYPHVLAFPLALTLMSIRRFPSRFRASFMLPTASRSSARSAPTND